jgi:hypothetical protein
MIKGSFENEVKLVDAFIQLISNVDFPIRSASGHAIWNDTMLRLLSIPVSRCQKAYRGSACCPANPAFSEYAPLSMTRTRSAALIASVCNIYDSPTTAKR